MRHTVPALLTLALAWGPPGLAAASGPAQSDGTRSEKAQPGAYCPFPKPGEAPKCFAAVQSEYSDFFAEVDSGQADRDDLDRVAARLAAGTDEDAALAVSSLAYAYYRYAERAAASPEADPAAVAQLEGLNDLLAGVYETAGDTLAARTAARTAVRDAARDLHERAPRVAVDCAEGVECESTGTLLARLALLDDPATAEGGLRGRLYQVYQRMFGDAAGEAK